MKGTVTESLQPVSVTASESGLVEIIGDSSAVPNKQTFFVPILLTKENVSVNVPELIGEKVAVSKMESKGTRVKLIVSNEKMEFELVILETIKVSQPLL